jgi:hypothetical protein
MVFTNVQTTRFFENVAQMGIPHATVVQLVEEGIDEVQDLAEFDRDTLTQVADNLRRPGGRIPNPDRDAPAGSTIAQPPFSFGAKAQKRLLAACDLVRYYVTVDRALTPGNMQWDPVMKNFIVSWKALKDRKNDETPEVPKISKTLSVIKWTEAFTDFLHRKIGVRMIPLAYVVRALVVPEPATALAMNLPYSVEHGSVEAEMIARASHTHELYRDDNSTVYYLLEEATRGTTYAPTIKPFQRAKNGREAWNSLITQYAGDDKWQSELTKQDELLHNRQWKGQSNFSLEKFIAQHRNAYVTMRQSAEHVTFQLPNERTRVTYLLDAIQTADPGLNAAMAQVRTDTDPETGRMNDFEATASYLLPYDPVSKKRVAGSKRGDISDTTGMEAAISSSSAFKSSSKVTNGKTGVEFRFYKGPEYMQLDSAQKKELHEWRDAQKTAGTHRNTGHGPPKKARNDSSQHKKWIASAVKAAMEKKANDSTVDDTAESDFKNYVWGLMASKQSYTKAATASSVETPKKVTLQSILRKVSPKK